MRSNIAKYFWSFNKKALGETGEIIKNPDHLRFAERMVVLLSRCDNPKELFSIIPKEEFIRNWPKIKSYWRGMTKTSDFRDWWQTIYEELMYSSRIKNRYMEKSSVIFLKIGRLIRNNRIQKGWTQHELALRVGMKQPDISKIEEGRKNITLKTLAFLGKVLEIKNIEL